MPNKTRKPIQAVMIIVCVIVTSFCQRKASELGDARALLAPEAPQAEQMEQMGQKPNRKKKTPANRAREYHDFFREKRLPPGASELPEEKYDQALAQMRNLRLYSTSEGLFADQSKRALGDLGSWEELGPGNIGGRTRALLIDPNDHSILYAAAVAGGVWKSVDAGASWSATGDEMANMAVVSLAMDPNDSQTLYAGTGEGIFPLDAQRGNGIFKTTDAGQSWTRLQATAGVSNFFYVNDLVISPNDSQRIYAATSRGVMRSLNGGTSWTRVFTSNIGEGCFDLAIRNDQALDVLFVTEGSFSQASIYRNTDAGGSGIYVNVLSESGMGRTTLSIAPSNQATIYALAAQNQSASFGALKAVYRSTDGGATWSTRIAGTSTSGGQYLLTNPLYAICLAQNLDQGWYDNVISVDPINENRVWAGGIDLFRSEDGGQNWGIASLWHVNTSRSDFTHADQHVIAFDPGYDGNANKRLYVCNDGGIFRTEDALASTAPINSATLCDGTNSIGISWSKLNNGYATTQFYQGAVYPDQQTYFGGTQDNGTVRGTDAQGPNAWSSLLGGDGGYVAVDPQNTNILYAEYFDISIQKSTNGGSSFTSAISGISDVGLFITPFAMDPNNSSILWTGGVHPWRTSNGATSWSKAGSFNGNGKVSAIAIAPGNSDLVLLGMSNGVIRRNAAATSANASSLWDSDQQVSGYISSISFDPNNTQIAYATCSTFGESHLLRTQDGGQNWLAIGETGANSIPDLPFHWVVVNPNDSQHLYLSSDLGVFVSLDGGSNWAVENTGFANVFTESLVLAQSGCHSQLFAFTHGRGVFKVALEDLNLDSSAAQFPSTGGDGQIQIETFSGCAWSATTQDSWISFPNGNSGQGPGTLDYRVAAGGTREGHILIGEQSFTVSQSGNCVTDLSPSAIQVGSAGELGSVSVSTNSACAWALESDVAWISFPNGNSGNGSANLNYGVAATNQSTTRVGHIQVESFTATVTQAGASCSYQLTPAQIQLEAAADDFSFELETLLDCQWNASSNDSWLQIQSASSGTGTATIQVHADNNGLSQSRQGSLTIADQNFVVTQDPCGAGSGFYAALPSWPSAQSVLTLIQLTGCTN